MNKSNEQYIEHEVKLRLHDHQFKLLESKLNFIIGVGISGLILPIILHSFKLI